MEIRPISWGDFDSVCELRLARYDEIAKDPDYGMVSGPSRPTRAELAEWFGSVQRDLLNGRMVSRVAVQDGEIVGMCNVTTEGNHPETKHVGVLGLEVRSAFQGRGIGRELLRATLEACRGKFELVDLSVIPENASARHLYQSLGFKEYGRRPRAFQREGRYHDFILMAREVD
jgi:ribosomal protein S18 acetylase RimI-like enzyme